VRVLASRFHPPHPYNLHIALNANPARRPLRDCIVSARLCAYWAGSIISSRRWDGEVHAVRP
jgi:hypothetical protein